ncbi:HAD family hydrolase [Kibdelosporangium aridum]|uniref:HAD family hydrolase n=1 Tax=Kibdelosporangium aridum TaxID=2030 RepID=A0A428YCI4_KIBAR|nr:HAD family hydrolase [Kibdelosporangium aridum]RSM65251.1 HAD family hydrolase [Kibdelosporangium aridum]
MPTGLSRPPKAIIFDLDGTLADTPNAIATITAAILEEMGCTRDEAEIRATVGKPLERNFAQLLDVPAGHADVSTAVTMYKKRFGAYVRETGPKLLYPGVIAGLESLRDKGIPLGVATSKVQLAAERTLAATGIAAFFTTVAGHDSVANGKPAPDLALRVAGMLGVSTSLCATVGDAVGDIQMGRAAGMYNIGVTYGVASADELTAAGADALVDDFAELVKLLSAAEFAPAD